MIYFLTLVIFILITLRITSDKIKFMSNSLILLFPELKGSYVLIIIAGLVTGITADIQAQKIYINEFLASNVTTNPDNVDWGDYSDWIELYNDEDLTVEISGYYLTDDLKNPTKWRLFDDTQIGAKQYLRIWADGNNINSESYHTNFNLSKSGEEIALFDPNGKLIDSIVYGSQITDVSFGRQPDGGDDWFYFGEPTPGTANLTEGTLNTETAPDVIFSLEAGFYNTSQSLRLSCESLLAEIRYTTDGSRPSSTSEIFNSEIIIETASAVRARVFESGKLPGKITTRSYFINTDHPIPVLSLTVFPETFWDEEIGIYENSLKGREMPVSVEFFEPDGRLGFNMNAGIRVTGEASVSYEQKPFTIEAKERFGSEFIDYQIFPTRNINNYSALYLRNGGAPDNLSTYMRDALEHSLVLSEMDIDGQAYRPAAVYLNGIYWGIYNLREKYNTQYFALHHNVNPDNLDILERGGATEGSSENFADLLNFVQNNDLSIHENYRYLKSKIDINEYLNYVIAEIFYANCDWLSNNIMWWRERSESGKYRWVLQDLDNGLGMESWYCHGDVSLDMLKIAVDHPDASYRRTSDNTALFRAMLTNEEFRNEFIQRFAGYMNTTFKTERIISFIDSLQNNISSEMVNHIDRWKDSPVSAWDPEPILEINDWNDNVEVLRNFARERHQYQRQHIEEYFNLSGSANLLLSISNSEFGKVYINGVEIPGNTINTYFKDISLNLEAYPKVGYRFVGWQGESDSISDSISIVLENDSELTAIFEPVDVSIIPSIISESLELNIDNSPYYAEGDVNVDSGATLTVNAGVEILMSENASIYINGIIDIIGSESEPVVIKPNESSVSGKWGALCIDSSNGHNSISYLVLKEATNGGDISKYIGAISMYKSDATLDNITILDAPFPVFAQYGNIVVRNSTLHSEKICDLINVKFASSALVENCDLRGNNAFDTDAIDYDGIENGIIRSNRIYNFYGFNSDGIDLGEGANNILVENNLIFNIFDKAISVGQASTTTIRNNVIVNCAQGVGIKDNYSYAYVNCNTFYGCNYGIASFEKNIGAGGGNVDVMNSIIVNSKTYPFFVDELSILNISYSLSDTDELPGTGNILADPLMSNEFRLKESSPAINSGNPASPSNEDGSRIDMGAFSYDESEQFDVVINEIHYNPSNGDEYEFIELYNTSDIEINLSGYKFVQALNFDFPIGTTIAAGEYIVAANNSDNYTHENLQVFDWGDQTLSNKWGNIELQDNEGRLADLVSYDRGNGWISSPDGSGPSLELRNTDLENLYPFNWQKSDIEGGTPGGPNKLDFAGRIYINELQANNNSVLQDEFGEYDDWIEIYNGSESPIDLGGLYITDDFDNPLKFRFPTIKSDSTTIEPGEYILLWADEDTEQGLFHLNFRLNSDGEELGLVYVFENDTTFFDSITWNRQEQDFSYGRKSDGSDEWKIIQVPTPGIPNSIPGLFEKGILLVNGLPTRTDAVTDAYEASAFWGNHPFKFWDLLPAPPQGYPSTLPEPIGQGAVPYDTLKNYSTVIWLGNFAGSGLLFWRESPIIKYLQHGGNIILLTTRGSDFLDDELLSKLGVSWAEPELARFENCVSMYPGIVEMKLIGMQITNSVFDIKQMDKSCTLLFAENVSFDDTVGIGVRQKPMFGGMYNEYGGQFVFISGRPFQYDHNDMRSNVDYILTEFFNEPAPVNVNEDNDAITVTEFALEQNYPNPFNPSTIIEYSLPSKVKSEKLKVKMVVYDMLGREIATLVKKPQLPGHYQVKWDAAGYSSGIYFYKLTAGKYRQTKKMILIK